MVMMIVRCTAAMLLGIVACLNVASATTIVPVGSGFNAPIGVAVDADGNVFVADSGNNAVKKVLAPDYATVVPVASGLGYPACVAVDAAGNLFVAEADSNAVNEYLAPAYTTVVPIGGGYATPACVALDAEGNAYVTDANHHALKKVLAPGYTTVKPIGSGLVTPLGIAFDGSGNIFVADGGDNRVKELLAPDYATAVPVGPVFGGLENIAVDAGGNVYVADTTSATLMLLLAPDYASVVSTGSGFNQPFGAAVDDSGNVFVADTNNNAIKEIRRDRCYVNRLANGANTGGSWTDAFAGLQSALNTACDDIWVAKGVYKPAGPGDPASSFNIQPAVAVYGGFAGNETKRNQRRPALNVTVLSGDIDGDDAVDGNGVDVDTSKIAGSNSHSVVVIDGTTVLGNVDFRTALDGFTITAGDGGNNGGGLFCNGTDIGHACSPTLQNLVFSGNRSQYGGAIATSGENGGASSPQLTNITLTGNYASIAGGAMYNEASSPSVRGATFSDNYSDNNGGAVYNVGGLNGGAARPVFVNATFSGNTALHNGGAMYNLTSPALFNDGGASCNTTLTNVTFSGNTVGFGGGPAMFNFNPFTDGFVNTVLRNVIIWGHSYPAVFNSDAATVFFYSVVQGSGGSGSWNLAFGVDGGGNLDAEPQLGPLQDNGGPTLTRLPGTGGSAIGHADDVLCNAAPVNGVDQRGVRRPQASHCDVGAVEVVTDRVFADNFDGTPTP